MLVSASYLAINLKNLFISCINVDIDGVLLLEQIRTEIYSFEVISLCCSCKGILVSLLSLLNNFRNRFHILHNH